MTRYIDADALIEKYIVVIRKAADEKLKTEIAVLLKDIEEQPTIDAVPVRHGKWITKECLPGVAVCSICGHEIRGIGCQYTKYCDECGARMDEE